MGDAITTTDISDFVGMETVLSHARLSALDRWSKSNGRFAGETLLTNIYPPSGNLAAGALPVQVTTAPLKINRVKQ